MSLALTIWLMALLVLARWLPAPLTFVAILLPAACLFAWQAWVLWIGWYVHQPDEGGEE